MFRIFFNKILCSGFLTKFCSGFLTKFCIQVFFNKILCSGFLIKLCSGFLTKFFSGFFNKILFRFTRQAILSTSWSIFLWKEKQISLRSVSENIRRWVLWEPKRTTNSPLMLTSNLTLFKEASADLTSVLYSSSSKDGILL